jgi:uncharacterized protein (TIGR02246 family)
MRAKRAWVQWVEVLLVVFVLAGVSACAPCGAPPPRRAEAAAAPADPAPAVAPSRLYSSADLPKPAKLSALVGATVWDGSGKPAIADAVVLMAGDRIQAVGPRSQVEVPAEAVTIDVKGKWIVPGLIDSHIHFFQSAGLYTRPDIIDLRAVRDYGQEQAALKQSRADLFRRYLVCGITAVVDMGGPFWNFDLRQEATSEPLAPRVAVAGPLVSTLARPQLDLGDPPIIQASTPARARELVAAQLARKPDLIKIWYIVLPDHDAAAAHQMMKATIEAAHAGKVRVAVHATELPAAKAVVEAGADILVHSVHDAPVDEALLDLMKARGTIYIPTLAVMDGYAEVLSGEIDLIDIEQRYGDPTVMASWTDLAAVQTAETAAVSAKRVVKMRARGPMMSANLKRVVEAGITVAAGTDAGNIGTLHGSSLHHELELMVQAGMSNEAVLLSATRNAALVFAEKPAMGTLEKGKWADLLVLDADPLADIKALRRIHSVIKGGVPLEPNRLVEPNPASVVQEQVEAYQARDLERFLATYALDVVIIKHPGGKVVAQGREAMRPIYDKLFTSSPKLNIRILRRTVIGSTVIDEELVTGLAKRPYVRAAATYQVEHGLITKVELRSAE